MKLLLVLACCLFLWLPGQAQDWDWDWYRKQQIRYVQMNGKRGIVRQYYPNILAPAVYDEVSWLTKGTLLVKRGYFYGIIDTLGVEKIKPDTYTNVSRLTDLEPGKTFVLLYIYKNEPEQNTLVDENGNIIARNFYQINEKLGNMIIVQVESGDSIQRKLFFGKNDSDMVFKYGILKLDGSWLIKPERRQLRFINNHCISADEDISQYTSKNITLLDLKGKPIINDTLNSFEYDRQTFDSLAKLNQFSVHNDLYNWFIDSMGRVVSKQPRNLYERNVAINRSTNKYGCKQHKSWLIQPNYDYIYMGSNYVFANYDFKRTDIYDKRGEFLASIDSIGIFSSRAMRGKMEDKELFFGRKADSTFLLNEKFIPISIPFDQPLPIIYSKKETTLFSFIRNNRIGVMNQAGKIIIEPKITYYHEPSIKDNLIWIETEYGKFNIYDLNGVLSFTNISTIKISAVNQDICYVKRNNAETVESFKNSKVIIAAGTYTRFYEIPKFSLVLAFKSNEQFILDKNFQLLNISPFSSIAQDSSAMIVTTIANKKQVLDISQNKFSKEYDYLKNIYRTGFDQVYLVRNANKYGLIDNKGKELINCEWDTLLFSEKNAVVKSGLKYYFTDTNYVLNKNINVDSIWPYWWSVGNSYSKSNILYKSTNKWRLLDYPNPEIEFDQVLECTSHNLVRVKKDGKYGVYSVTDKKWKVKPVFESEVTTPNNYYSLKQVFFTQKKGKKHFIDTLKNVVLEPGFDFIEPQFLMVDAPNKTLENSLVNDGGKISASITPGSKTNTLTGGKFGIINPKGKLVHPMNGDQVITLIDENYGYSDDYVIATVLGFLWNVGGTVEEYMSYMPDSVEQATYDELGNEYIVKVAGIPGFDKKITGGKFGIVGPNGKEILPVIYDKIIFMYNNTYNDRDKYYRKSYNELPYSGPYDKLALFPVFLNKANKWGAADLSGKLIIPVEYDSIADASIQDEKTIQVWKNGQYGYFELFGKTLLPVELTNEKYFDSNNTYGEYTTSFSIIQKGGSVKNYYFVQKREQTEYTETGEEKKFMVNDTIRYYYFVGGKLGIFDLVNCKTLLSPEYDDIRFMQEAKDSTDKSFILRLSVTQKTEWKPSFKASQDIPYFEIKKSGKWGIYSFDKGIIVKPRYEDIEVIAPTTIRASPEYAYKHKEKEESGPTIGFKFKQAGKWGVLNPDGKTILKAQYDTINFTEGGFYKVVMAGQVKLFDINGNPVKE